MSEEGRIRVSTVTEGKMLAKKMHRLVKKMQDKPGDALDAMEMLSEMARKRGENLTIPIEVETEAQWSTLIKREGLIVVDVYSGWSGPCTSMFSILRKLKLDANDDRLILAAANADNISQLAPFRNQSEPCWLFLGGGKPVKVLRGSNAPKLMRMIKSEFQYELDCIAGKSKRNLISMKYEASRKEQAVKEAIGLNELMALEEEEKKVQEKEPSPAPSSNSNEEVENEESVAEKDAFASTEDPENAEEDTEVNAEEKAEAEEKERAAKEMEEQLQVKRRLMEESNVRLKDALKKYTVIAIQSYLLETGAVTEIKDHLAGDFILERERYITLSDDDARKLFGIPAEMPDPNPPVVIGETPTVTEDLGEGQEGDSAAEEMNTHSASQSPVPASVQGKSAESQEIEADATNLDASVEDADENSEAENEKSRSSREQKSIIRMIEIPVPSAIIGDTLIMLLDCTRVSPKEPSAGDEVSADVDMEDADYYISRRIGPGDYEMAVATQPESLHAMYGKEKYVAGIWCPRKYEDKRFVMLNYFPQFVTELLMPAIPDPPKYQLFVFSALFSTEILEHSEYLKNKADVIAEARRRIPLEISEKMLIASKKEGEMLRALKWALTGTDLLIISIDKRNDALVQTLNHFKPVFASVDHIEASYFTAQIFHDVEVLVDEEPFLQAEPEPQGNTLLANLVVKMVANVVETEDCKDARAAVKGNQEEKDRDKANVVEKSHSTSIGQSNDHQDGKSEDFINNNQNLASHDKSGAEKGDGDRV